jgi:TrmH family RNA methyltransferase
VEYILEYYIVLIEPKYSGNIGAVARCMKNFGLTSLYLVNPCEIDKEARMRAVHAQEILDNARIFDSFERVREELDYTVATSSIVGESEKRYLRYAVSLRDFIKQAKNLNGRVGIVFGREDYGLYNHEIASCDAFITIPTSDEYRSLNLSHAVAIVLYELFENKEVGRETKRMGRVEIEKLNESLAKILELIDYPSHKIERTKIMLRRLIGRANPSIWEYHTIMGILSEVIRRIR